jgi:hypothetical protein
VLDAAFVPLGVRVLLDGHRPPATDILRDA